VPTLFRISDTRKFIFRCLSVVSKPAVTGRSSRYFHVSAQPRNNGELDERQLIIRFLLGQPWIHPFVCHEQHIAWRPTPNWRNSLDRHEMNNFDCKAWLYFVFSLAKRQDISNLEEIPLNVNFVWRLSAVAAVLATVACGGGGGGSAPAPTTTGSSTTGSSTTGSSTTGSSTTGSLTTGSSTTSSTTSTNPVAVAPVAAPTSSVLSGVAATGAAFSGATITIRDANGLSQTTTAAADGSYAIDVTAMTAPFVLIATGNVGDTTLTLVSAVAEKPAAGGNLTANVSPLTHAVAAMLATSGDPMELASASSAPSSITKARVNDLVSKLNAAVSEVLKDAGLDPSTFSPISTAFTANRTGADRVLELVAVQVSGKGVQLINKTVADDGNGSASVTVTADGAQAVLPKPPPSYALGFLDFFKTQLDRCFADSANNRVVKDASGNPFITAGNCATSKMSMFSNATPAYKSAGANLIQTFGALLSDTAMDGAVWAVPEILFTDVADKRVYFRQAYKRTDGGGGFIVDIAEKAAGGWQLVGDQIDLDAAVEGRADNYTEVNPNYTGISDVSRYTTGFRLYVNPLNSLGVTIQAARVKGPGLPAAGVMMHNSSICGTADYLTVTYKNGNLNNAQGNTVNYNSNTSNAFILNAQPTLGGVLDWSKRATFVNYADTPVPADQIAALPVFAKYTFEIWLKKPDGSYRGGLSESTPADTVYTKRNLSRPPTIEQVKAMSWNAFDARSLMYIDPSNSLAAATDTVIVSWTKTAAAEPVDSAQTFGSKWAPGVTTIRARAQKAVTTLERSKTLTIGLIGAGHPLAGTNCANAQLPALGSTGDATQGTYREIILRSRTSNFVRKFVTSGWSNYNDATAQ
jgi:hypothetical protein